MTIITSRHPAQLEERTIRFSKRIIYFCDQVPKTLANTEIIRQLIRSAGSVGANYIEANEALSKKDFIYRLKIVRKEAKESEYWLRLINPSPDESSQQAQLLQEANELRKIFSAILIKCE